MEAIRNLDEQAKAKFNQASTLKSKTIDATDILKTLKLQLGEMQREVTQVAGQTERELSDAEARKKEAKATKATIKSEMCDIRCKRQGKGCRLCTFGWVGWISVPYQVPLFCMFPG